jgi:hypothetical protein
VFYDTEFIDDGKTIELISIGMVDEDGKTYYAVVEDVPMMTRAIQHPWLSENVVCHLPVKRYAPGEWRPDSGRGWWWDFGHKDYEAVKGRETIADEVRAFLLEPGLPFANVELWAWFGAYDHVALAQLFGSMISLPPGIPMFTHELVQRWEECGRPERPAQHSAHNALTDAYWDRALWMRCEAERVPALARRR